MFKLKVFMMCDHVMKHFQVTEIVDFASHMMILLWFLEDIMFTQVTQLCFLYEPTPANTRNKEDCSLI